jgi:hypothetical protein
MIISYAHHFLFFAVPKTGTHSVRRALRAHLGPHDLEQVGLYEPKRFPFPEFAAIRHGHISARQIEPVIGTDVFAGLFKFAFVRNPYDRFVSYCAFMSRDTGHFEREPTRFMKHILQVVRPLDHLLYRPQSSFLVDAQGRLAVDYVGRTENMQASYDAICARIGIASSSLEKVNASTHADYRQYYDDESRALVGDLYRRDLELFDYGFEEPPAQPAQDEIDSAARTG